MDLELHLSGYEIKRLSYEDTEALQALLGESSDYMELAFGRPTKPTDAVSLLRHVPKDKSLDDKRTIGIYDREKLIGILDIVKDYPTPETWFIGLLLFVPSVRNRSLGSKVFRALVAALKNTDARTINISVVNQNTAGRRFWEKLGFKETEKGREGESEITFFEYSI